MAFSSETCKVLYPSQTLLLSHFPFLSRMVTACGELGHLAKSLDRLGGGLTAPALTSR